MRSNFEWFIFFNMIKEKKKNFKKYFVDSKEQCAFLPFFPIVFAFINVFFLKIFSPKIWSQKKNCKFPKTLFAKN